MNSGCKKKREALTLIELLIVIVVVGVLLSLAMTAVQAARQAARNFSCKNNLKQLALAVHQYEASHQCMPPASTLWGHSTHLVLLPYLEQGAILYDKIDFSLPVGEIAIGSSDSNRRIRGAQLSTFLCPEEGLSEPDDERRIGRTNYAGNFGIGAEKYGYNGALLPLAPIGTTQRARRDSGRVMRMSEFIDGTSSTSLFSEYLISFEPSADERRVTFHLPFEYGVGYQFDSFCAICSIADQRHEFELTYNGHGQHLFYGLLHDSLYNHALPPNSLTCTYATEDAGMGVCPASSNHARGVNVANVDGSVSFYSDDVSLTVWRQLGARDDATLSE